jgi:hypothetical protein
MKCKTALTRTVKAALQPLKATFKDTFKDERPTEEAGQL